VLCLFLTAVVLALMAKAAPQLNLFSFGFALRIGVGLVAGFLLLPDLIGGVVASIGYLNDLVLQLG
jgi:flagellar biosynthesis protein FliR